MNNACMLYLNAQKISKNHNTAVSGEFCVISLFLQKLIFRGYVTL